MFLSFLYLVTHIPVVQLFINTFMHGYTKQLNQKCLMHLMVCNFSKTINMEFVSKLFSHMQTIAN